jgi:UDP-glucose 4-epimerase
VRIPTGADEKDEYIYVQDVASALLAAALKSSPTAFGLYNAGSGDLRSTAELAAIVRSVVPSSDIEIGPGLDPMGLGIPYYFVFDSSRARIDLGFEAEWDLESGVRDYVRVMETLKLPEAVG